MKFKNLLCTLAGHQYHLVHSFTPWMHKLQCTRCRKYFALNEHFAHIIPWTEELELMIKNLEAVMAAEKRAINPDFTFTINNVNETVASINHFPIDPNGPTDSNGDLRPGS